MPWLCLKTSFFRWNEPRIICCRRKYVVIYYSLWNSFRCIFVGSDWSTRYHNVCVSVRDKVLSLCLSGSNLRVVSKQSVSTHSAIVIIPSEPIILRLVKIMQFIFWFKLFWRNKKKKREIFLTVSFWFMKQIWLCQVHRIVNVSQFCETLIW